MHYKLQCKNCSATCWVRGDYEDDTNATNLDELSDREWEGSNQSMEQSLYHPPCPHSDFNIIDSEVDDDSDG